MGWFGVRLDGDGHVVEDMRLRSNGGFGIFVVRLEGPSVVRNNTLVRNGYCGIFVATGVVQGNVVGISHRGIVVSEGSSVLQNVVYGNDRGLEALGPASMIGNTMTRNTMSVVGLVDRGQNTCDGGPCF